MTNDLELLEQQLQEAKRQKEVQEHLVERLSQREKYVRKAKDRRRTHRLIQYGVAFEANDRRLAELTVSEVFSLVEHLLEIPVVRECLDQAVADHASKTGGDQQ